MTTASSNTNQALYRSPFGTIARRIGTEIKRRLDSPEAEPIPTEHAELVLRLRQRERDAARQEDRHERLAARVQQVAAG